MTLAASLVTCQRDIYHSAATSAIFFHRRFPSDTTADVVEILDSYLARFGWLWRVEFI